MKRQRKTYSKRTKFALVCIALVVSNIGSVIAKAASLFEAITFTLFVIGPALFQAYKNDRDPMCMLPGAPLRGAIWVGMFLGTASLSKNSTVLEKIFLWPVV